MNCEVNRLKIADNRIDVIGQILNISHSQQIFVIVRWFLLLSLGCKLCLFVPLFFLVVSPVQLLLLVQKKFLTSLLLPLRIYSVVFSLQFLFIVAVIIQTFLEHTYVDQFSFLRLLVYKCRLYQVFTFVKNYLFCSQKAADLVTCWLESLFDWEWRFLFFCFLEI